MIIKNIVSVLIVGLMCIANSNRAFVSSQNCTAKNTNLQDLQEYPKLAGLGNEIVSALRHKGLLNDGGHSLNFLNWKEKTLRLACPEKDADGRYIWEQHCHFENKNTSSGTDGRGSANGLGLGLSYHESRQECDDFNKQYYSSHRLIIPAPDKCGPNAKLFRTYSCAPASRRNCKHYTHVIIPPLPDTQFPGTIYDNPPGSLGTFNCTPVRCKLDKSENLTDSVFGPVRISWRGPNGHLLKTNSLPGARVTVEYEYEGSPADENADTGHTRSTVRIKNPIPETCGIFECVLTSVKYGMESTPHDRRTVTVDGVNVTQHVFLISGVRYDGFAHVHCRPELAWVIPSGIIVALFVILVLMIRFCPERGDEADVEADDEDELAELKRSLKAKARAVRLSGGSGSEDSGGGSGGGTGKNGLGLSQIQEEKESLSHSHSDEHAHAETGSAAAEEGSRRSPTTPTGGKSESKKDD